MPINVNLTDRCLSTLYSLKSSCMEPSTKSYPSTMNVNPGYECLQNSLFISFLEEVNISRSIKALLVFKLLLSISSFCITILLSKSRPTPNISRTRHTRRNLRPCDRSNLSNKKHQAFKMVSKKNSAQVPRDSEKAPVFNITNGAIYGCQCYGGTENRFSVQRNRYTAMEAFNSNGGKSTHSKLVCFGHTES
jgi:hypothetical protein